MCPQRLVGGREEGMKLQMGKKSKSNVQYRFPSMNSPSISTTGHDHMHLDAFSHPTFTWDLLP